MASRGAQVWVVEDDGELRELLCLVLRRAGLEVRDFADGQDVLQALGPGHRPDLLVTDHHLGRVHGLDLVEALRAQDIGVPVLLVTAFADPRVRRRAARSADVELVEKPCDVYGLRRRVLARLGAT